MEQLLYKYCIDHLSNASRWGKKVLLNWRTYYLVKSFNRELVNAHELDEHEEERVI